MFCPCPLKFLSYLFGNPLFVFLAYFQHAWAWQFKCHCTFPEHKSSEAFSFKQLPCDPNECSPKKSHKWLITSLMFPHDISSSTVLQTVSVRLKPNSNIIINGSFLNCRTDWVAVKKNLRILCRDNKQQREALFSKAFNTAARTLIANVHGSCSVDVVLV